MSGTKISLDAAMRARDVSPAGSRDGEPPDCDEAGGPATVGATEGKASEPAVSEADEPSATAASSAAKKVVGGDQRRRAGEPRRRRRRRLRRGRPA
jgi:hypothetical protein